MDFKPDSLLLLFSQILRKADVKVSVVISILAGKEIGCFNKEENDG